MPRQGAPDTDQFSITLPLDAIEEIENGLIHFGHYGKNIAVGGAASCVGVGNAAVT
jgi:hypothetical protein